MRPKFVLSVLVLTLVVVVAAFLLKQPAASVVPQPETAPASAVTTATPTPALPKLLPPTVPEVVKTPTPQVQAAAIKAEKAQLTTWEMNNDPQSLSNILNDLTSPEKDIRLAAIEAAKQFDSTDAIPALKAAAINTTDTEEQIAMLKAAEFLALPDATLASKGDGPAPVLTPEEAQAQAQSRAKAAARHQEYLQAHHPDQVQNASGTAPGNSSPAPAGVGAGGAGPDAGGGNPAGN